MRNVETLGFLLSAGVAWLATRQVRTHAMSGGRLDLPNARSSHATPTPRGGGVAIVLTVVLGLAALWGCSALDTRAALALGAGGLCVALVGYLDDVRDISPLPRLTVHVVAAGVATCLLAGQPGYEPVLGGSLSWLTPYVLTIGIVWSINLFNFMDGIDGIAATEAAFVAGASAWLMTANDASAWKTLAAMTCGASLGFLAWNLSPAKIFMGDVGSGFLGYWLAVLGVALHVTGVLSIWTSLILGSVFIADASVTLARRMARGDRWFEAHRSHAYQHLALRWGSHRRVTALVCALDCLLVLPLAYASILWRAWAPAIAAVVVALFGLCSLALGAGKPSSHQVPRPTRTEGSA